eukprot:5675026-Pleurochrysis_carterae.AAC.2
MNTQAKMRGFLTMRKRSNRNFSTRIVWRPTVILHTVINLQNAIGRQYRNKAITRDLETLQDFVIAYSCKVGLISIAYFTTETPRQYLYHYGSRRTSTVTIWKDDSFEVIELAQFMQSKVLMCRTRSLNTYYTPVAHAIARRKQHYNAHGIQWDITVKNSLARAKERTTLKGDKVSWLKHLDLQGGSTRCVSSEMEAIKQNYIAVVTMLGHASYTHQMRRQSRCSPNSPGRL